MAPDKSQPEVELEPQLDLARHIKYWKRCHQTVLPTVYTGWDSTRMALAFFIVAAHDLLQSADASTDLLTPSDRLGYRKWILSLQRPTGGFAGSPTMILPFEDAETSSANIAATSFALLTLALLAEEKSAGDAFMGVSRTLTLRWLRRLQREDGSFGEILSEDGKVCGGRDMRYCYLAATIRWCLRGDMKKGEANWVEDIDVPALIAHIRRAQTYDGGIAESSENESHGGYAYCAVAALSLLDRSIDPSDDSYVVTPSVESGIRSIPNLIRFLAFRQMPNSTTTPSNHNDQNEDSDPDVPGSQLLMQDDQSLAGGFNGRCNKAADTCYCWWVGAALSLLGKRSLIGRVPARRFLLEKGQHRIGGFGKYPGAPPDIYHSYLGLAALAMMGDEKLGQFDAALCVSKSAAARVGEARAGLIAYERSDRSRVLL